jgi:hypothetical protein
VFHSTSVRHAHGDEPESIAWLTACLFIAPRNLKVFKHARRLRIDVSIGADPGQDQTDNFYEETSDPFSRNLLADYLLQDAPCLESLETTWFPIFSVKECLPRFACLSLYYCIDRWKLEQEEAVPPQFLDKPLQRNVRRLRSALRRRALDLGARSGQAQDTTRLAADDVMSVGRTGPFERDDTWTAWLSDEKLMQEVAAAFNSCPWALHDDLPPNPISTLRSNELRKDWPLEPYLS